MSRKQAQITEALSIRLPKTLHDRLFDVIRATDCEITRTDLVVQALETYLALLSARPSLLAGYDREKDVSARQKKDV